MWIGTQIILILMGLIIVLAVGYGAYLIQQFLTFLRDQQERVESLIWMLDEQRWESFTTPIPRVGNGKKPPSNPRPPSGTQAG